MSRNQLIISAILGVVVLVALIAFSVMRQQDRPAVEISTPNAEVSIGSGGVSVSVTKPDSGN